MYHKLSLEAQNYCDEIPDFEQVFQAAKSNLQSMPLGDVDCSLLLACSSSIKSSNTSLSNEKTNTGSQHKAFGLLKNFFFRSTNSSKSTNLSRRPSNASIVSSTGQMLEVVPGGIR
ncbi:hypothetical protein BLA29_008146 [Euroglyphus maynei]|uniref:Uncharacterized protein n=1 Tax=Euroglyphus maynei TaxID=6958 RepID=A0A1Y3B6R4_EURMA|nr:hypothetical protein BLA29_008146 [Euroglyphus maynei]